MRLRALNHNGIERFRSALGQLRQGASPELPTALLDDPAHTEDVSVDIDLTARTFTSRLQLGEYLNEALEPLQDDEIERNRGLWAWLSLWLFDVVCPIRADGTRRPGRDYRHIPDFGYRHRHRHLLLEPELDADVIRFWLALLLCFDVVFVTLALWTFEPVMTD
jgi:hypothetical protein